MEYNGQTIQIIEQTGSPVPDFQIADIEVSTNSVMGVPAYLQGVRFAASAQARLPIRKRISNETEKRELKNDPHIRMLTRRCNDYASPFVTLYTWYSHREQYWNGYLKFDSDGMTLTNLDPQDTIPFKFGDRKYFYLQSRDEVLDNTQVLHIMNHTNNGVIGVNPLVLFKQSHKHIQTLKTFACSYFENGTHINGVILVPAGVTEEQLKKMSATFSQFYSGAKKAGKTPILPFGSSFQNTTTNNEQSQLAELSALTVDEVAQMQDLPPVVYFKNSGAGAWATIPALNNHLVTHSLGWRITSAEAELDKLLSNDDIKNGVYFEIDSDSLLRGDPARTAEIVSRVQSGLLTRNEARELEDLEPLPGGDVMLDPINQAQVTKATPQASAADPIPTDSAPTYSAVFLPLIEDAAAFVDGKTYKAMEAKGEKLAPDAYMAWKSNFAQEQERAVISAFEPIAKSFATATKTKLDVASIAEKYRKAIEAATIDTLFVTTLKEDAEGLIK